MSKEMMTGYDPFDFIRGQADCREGIPHKSGQSESYDAGYSAEYQLTEIKSQGAANEIAC